MFLSQFFSLASCQAVIWVAETVCPSHPHKRDAETCVTFGLVCAFSLSTWVFSSNTSCMTHYTVQKIAKWKQHMRRKKKTTSLAEYRRSSCSPSSLYLCILAHMENNYWVQREKKHLLFSSESAQWSTEIYVSGLQLFSLQSVYSQSSPWLNHISKCSPGIFLQRNLVLRIKEGNIKPVN